MNSRNHLPGIRAGNTPCPLPASRPASAAAAPAMAQAGCHRAAPRPFAATVAALLLLAAHAYAATVGSSGYTNDFASQPPAADWSTRAVGTTSAASAITTADGLDGIVQTNTAGGITGQCASSSTSPPASASTAAWCSSGYLQTRASGNAATLLMATFINNTGSNATAVQINYDFVTNRASLVAEEVRGVRAYYSLGGAANSWSNIAAFSQTGQGTLSLQLTLPAPWTNGGKFYLLWADDNGSANGADDANDFDNFYLAITGGAPVPASCSLNTPINGQSFGAVAAVALSASASPGEGATNTGVGFYDVTNGLLASALAAPYAKTVHLSAGLWSIYAVATNSLGLTIFSATNTITVTNAPLAVALNGPASGQSFAETVSLSATSTVTGGSAPYAYAVTFYTNAAGGPVGAAATAGAFPAFTAALGTLPEGTYQIYAEATDGAATVRSATNTFSTVGPIKVPAGGLTLTFDTAPSALKWSTYSVTGASGTAQTMAEMDAGMAAISAASITTALSTQSASGAASLAYWRSSDQKIGTQPSGNRETLLMATLFNNTGAEVSRLDVAYTFGLAAAVPSETNKGHRVYYSTTGAANSWNALGFFTLASAGAVTTNFSVTGLAWAPATRLYLVWLDENGTNPDGDYTLDNISFTPTLAGLNVAMTAPVNGQLFVSGASIPANASVVSGVEPYVVRFYTNSGAGNTVFAQAGPALAAAPFAASLGSLPAGTYNMFAEVTDAGGFGARAGSATNTFSVADPLSITLTDPAQGASFDRSLSIGATGAVAGGTSPFTVRFYTNNALAGAADGNSGAYYFKNLGALFIGSHTVQAVVTDSRGWQATSEPHTVTITGAVFAALTPTNGAFYNYGSSITLTAAVAGGAAPYTATFYTNDQLAAVAGPGPSPFLLPLGVLPAGAYTNQVVVLDADGGAAPSTTNVLTILPNPLAAVLTSPANGQSFRSAQPVTLTASVAVSAPVAISAVEFYVDDALVATDTVAPYSTNLAGLPEGAHAIYAAATDSLGRRVCTATNAVTMTNAPLAVVLTGPANGQSFPETVSLSATSTVSGGSAPYAYAVTFYTNAAGGPVGTVTAAGALPTFTAALGTFPEGTYQIYAEATDGATTARSATNTFSTVGPIKVPAAGLALAFDTAPSALKWSTYSVSGSSSTAQTMAEMDAGMAAISAASITTALSTQTGSGATALAYWRSSDQRIGTQPSGNRETLLMATLVNDTGVDVSRLDVAYTFGLAAATPSEVNKGHRVYYSTTGAANSWNALGFLTLASVGSVTTNFSVTGLAWAPATKLYLVWLDENGTNPDGDYTLDNISFTPTLAVLNVAVTAPVNGQVFVSGSSIPANATVVSGVEPYVVRFYTNSGAGNPVFDQAGAALTTAPFTAALGSLPAGAYNIYAEVTDAGGLGARAGSATNSFAVVDPLSITLTDPAQGSGFDWPLNIGATSVVAGGTSPFTVRFYTNSVLAGAADGNSGESYFKSLGALFMGSHTVHAVVTDSRGWQATSEVHTVTITGPVFVTLAPANGAFYNYGSAITLTAAVVGGAAPYTTLFYTNDTMAAAAGPGPSPFLLPLGMLPAGAYTNLVVARDADSAQALSTTNVLTILPNPLAAVLTSPANGQSYRSAQTVTLTAAVAVSAPVAIYAVEFYVDDASVGTNSVAPYSMSLTGYAEGAHTVYAAATDSLGRRVCTATNTIEFLNLPLGIIVGASGCTNSFDTQPPASEWSTRAFGSTGSGGSSEIASAAALDAAVQTNTASLITSQLGSSNATPPAAAGPAAWSTSGYVQTRPTQCAATLLMATLVNNTCSNATAIRIAYDYATNRASLVTEEVRGLRVYYSLSGAANSWSNIPALSQTDQGALSADVTLSEVWSNGAVLYLLWADDNGSGGPGDTANDIDNFFVGVVGAEITTLTCALTSPAAGASYGAPSIVTLAAAATPGEGASLTGVGFYEVEDGFLGGDLAAPYAGSVILNEGTYHFYAVATNSLGETVFSATNTVTVTNVPLSVALSSPANAASFGAPASLTLSANAYPGTGAVITGVGFFDAATGPLGSAMALPYTTSATLNAGTYSVYAVATNSLNAMVFSATNTITVTNVPLSVALTSPANGAALGSPATVNLSATATAGTGGWPIASVAFYQAGNGTPTFLFADTEAPYSNQISGLVDGSYSFFAVVTNSLNETAVSTTNAITVSSIVAGTVTRGPYLGSRGTTNITIRWRTTQTTVGRVRFGPAPGSLTSFADDSTSRADHSVTLTGLAPETQYYYSIGTTAGTVQASANYYFVTAPPAGSSRATRMWFLSDYGGGDATQIAVRDAYLNFTATNGQATDIWLTGGDNEQSGMGGADATYQSTVFNVYSNIFQNTPVFPTCGNHDGMASSAYWSIYSMPTQGECGGAPSGSQHYYSFDYANVHFISLDAYNNGSGAGASSAQLQWLTNDLAGNTQPWIIAYWHQPPYCKNFYDSDTDAMCKATRENFNPVLEAYGTDIVMNGHCHALQRTYPINGFYGVASTYNATNQVLDGDGRADGDGAYQKTTKRGTIYITAPSGCGLAHPGTATMAAFAERLSYTLYGCLVLDVNSNRLDFKMLSSAGAVSDYFTILKPVSEVTRPALAGSPGLTNGVFVATFQATAGLTYTLQSEDVLNNTWRNRSNITAAADGRIVIQAPAGEAANRFFRLIYPAQ